MALSLSRIASMSLKKWFTNNNSLRQTSLPLFRPSKSKPSSDQSQIVHFPNNSWPRKSLSPSREDELRQVFRFFDENKDGKISIDELRLYFVSVGDSMSHEEATKVVNEFDKDGDSLLEFGDFVELIEQDEEERDDHVRKAFEMFVEVEKGSSSSSSASSGCITPTGLQQVLKRLGNAKSFDECKAMIGVYDLDGNGVLDFNEFQRMMS